MRLGARFACTTLAFTGLVTFAACGSSGGGGDDDGDDDDTTTPDANTWTPPPDADLTGYTELIGRDWTMAPGERYKCIRIQAAQDMYIQSFQAQAPQGTHHTVVTIKDQLGGQGGSDLGEYECEVNTLDLQMLFASGVGTDALTFPDGVAMKIEAGQYINLNLHLFNTQGSADLSGHSGVWVKTIPVDQVVQEAEMVFAGTMDFTIEAGMTGEASGGCTFNQPATIMTYWPHMHQIATHQKVTLTVGGQQMVIHDEPFSFEEQKNYTLDPPIQVQSGDSINVVCSYDNTAGEEDVTFGDSSNTEMCFTGLYRYPKQAFTLFDCAF
jgi:hypothetical protein